MLTMITTDKPMYKTYDTHVWYWLKSTPEWDTIPYENMTVMMIYFKTSSH